MKTIKNKIVFSNDIKRILKGNNVLNYSLEKKNMTMPNKFFFKELRNDFLKDTTKIFNKNVEIIPEGDMLEQLYNSTSYYRGLPHCITR